MNKYGNSFHRNESQTILWLLFLLVVILSLLPFFKIGFATADDWEYYMRTLKGGVFEDASRYAKMAGRFYFLITKPLYHFPYLIDNFYFTKFVQYGSLLLSFTLFAIVVRKLFEQKELSMLIFLLLFSFLSVPQHIYFMPIIAYPFFFSFSFSLFLLSILLQLKYWKTKKYKYMIFSAMVFALALLFYETYLIFLFFICVLVLFQNIVTQGKQTFSNKSFYKEILPFILVGVIYVAAYFLYRASLQGHGEFYGGASVAKDFNVRNFFKILWNYNLSAVPTYTYHDSQSIIAANSLLETGHRNDFWYILTHTQITSLINTLLQCLIFWFLCHKMGNKVSWKKISIASFTLITLTFSSHIFIGIAEKYNSSDWWCSHKGYVTTFFPYFFITLFICLVIYAAIKACHGYKWVKNSVIITFTLFLFYTSTIIGYSNEHLSRDWAHNQTRFNAVDNAIKQGIFDNVAEDAIICSTDLCSSSSVMADIIFWQSSFVWRNFVYVKTRKQMNIYDKIEDVREKFSENTQQEIYYISHYDSPKNQDILLILSKVNNESINTDEGANMFHNATSNEAIMYQYSPHNENEISTFKSEQSFFVQRFMASDGE